MFAKMKTGTKILAGLGIVIAIAAILAVAGPARSFANPPDAGVKPDEAYQRLKDGNGRFAEGKSTHPNITAARRQETTKNGQKPFATVLSCSDSRVPAETVFDQGVGDVFVVRVAGNVCDVDEAGSIEYGVDHLGTPLLVVLGHTHCGAVTAVVTSAEVHGNISPLVAKIRPAAEKAGKANASLHGKDLVPAAIEANVWQVIDDLLKSSETVRNRAKEGKVKVVGAIYDLENGQVKWLGEHPEKARLFAYTGGASHGPATPAAAHAPATPTAEAHASASPAAAAHAPAQTIHAKTKVTAENVTLIEAGKLAQLDTARHREVKAEEVHLADTSSGWTMLAMIGVGLGVIGVVALGAWKAGWFARLTVAGQMYTGFAAVLGVLLALGGVGYYSLTELAKEAEIEKIMQDLDTMASDTAALQNEYLLKGIEDKAAGDKMLKEYERLVAEFDKNYQHVGSLHVDAEERDALAKIQKSMTDYKKSFDDMVKKYREVGQLKESLEKVAEETDTLLSEIRREHEKDLEQSGLSQQASRQAELLTTITEAELFASQLARSEADFLNDKQVGRVGKMQSSLGGLLGQLKAARTMISAAARDKQEETTDLAKLAKLEEAIGKYQSQLAKVVEDELDVESDEIECNRELKQFAALTQAVVDKTERDAKATKSEANTSTAAMIAIGLLIGAIAGFVTARGITKVLQALIAEARRLSQAAVAGQLQTRGNPELVTAEFRPIVEGVNATLDAVIGPLNVAAEYVDRISKGDIPPKITDTYQGDFNEIKNNLNQCIDVLSGLIAEMKHMSDEHNKGDIDVAIPIEEFRGAYKTMAQGINEMVVGHIAVKKKAMACIAEFGKGNFEAPLEKFPGKKAFINDTVEELRANLKGVTAGDIGQTLKRMADKDFSKGVEAEYPGDFAMVKDNVNLVVEALRGAIEQINESANQFAEGSRVIAESSQTLASGSQEQSSSVQQVTASIEELSRSVQGVKDNAHEADKVSKETTQLAEQGAQAVRKSGEAMEQIKTSSDQIAEIIQVISEIASQTNLLALNAAIEAARAGEHGMGFAVVADEVRKLAERSNQAAGEITKLIKESGTRVLEGANLSQETEEALKKIVTGVQATAGKIGEIAAATVQQASNAEEVSKAVQGISQVTEQAAAGSEEMASSSEQLGAQAQALRDLVMQFNTHNGQSGHAQTVKSEAPRAQAAACKAPASQSKARNGNGHSGQDQAAKTVAV